MQPTPVLVVDQLPRPRLAYVTWAIVRRGQALVVAVLPRRFLVATDIYHLRRASLYTWRVVDLWVSDLQQRVQGQPDIEDSGSSDWRSPSSSCAGEDPEEAAAMDG